MKMIPLAKQSKAKQREYHAAKRGSWNGVSPVCRIVPSRKAYDRARMKREERQDFNNGIRE